jgi:thymidylate synthase ThyX
MTEIPSPQPAASPYSQPEVEVYAVYGAEPEVQAYAMAKYSRSALSMKETLAEINAQRAEKFLNTFYFQYGHRSIADLAHIAMAVERLSILAAVALVDEQRWDGQERSTRYQDFKKGGHFVPDLQHEELERLYRDTIVRLMAEYEAMSEGMWRYLADRTPKPPEMKDEQYERTLRARAFDIARYLLPLATNTSLGQIVNARTLENQVARLLSSDFPEIRRLGELLKRAAREPAYNVNHYRYQEIVDEARGRDDMWGKQVREDLLHPVSAAPTLVKYAEASPYMVESARDLRQAARDLMQNAAIADAAPVTLLDDEPLETELTTTLLYEHCHYPYRQIRKRVETLDARQRQEIIDLGMRHRGPHDELLRACCAGQKFRFDILMDIGAYRDLHRHRRCIQIAQGFTTAHGYDTPDEMRVAGIRERYEQAMREAAGAAARISAEHAETSGQYLIPLGYRKRALFKMDFAEVVYIAELRTGVGGHISYRRIAWQMYQETARRYPGLARYFRVQDPREPVDLLQR